MTDTGVDARAEARLTVALAALADVTDVGDIGALIDATEVEPGLVDLHFATTLPGYPGWRWTVSTALVDGGEPTVLELALVPGEGALLAPPWVPWTERLAEWRRSHPADGDEIDGAHEQDESDADDLDDDDLDDDLDLDPDDVVLDDDVLETGEVEPEDDDDDEDVDDLAHDDDDADGEDAPGGPITTR